MIVLYSAVTPNGVKISIALEEMGLPYQIRPVDIMENEQLSPDFLAMNPNGKIPVIQDTEAGFTLSESVVILEYLAQKTGVLWPGDVQQQFKLKEMLTFQAAHVGPMLGQYGHFAIFAEEKVPYGIARYETESRRLFGVLETVLADQAYLMGEFGLADIAHAPWVLTMRDHYGFDVSAYPKLSAWCDRFASRSAVQRGVAALMQ